MYVVISILGLPIIGDIPLLLSVTCYNTYSNGNKAKELLYALSDLLLSKSRSVVAEMGFSCL